MGWRDILVIAGYDVLADEIPPHRRYVKESFERGISENVNQIFVVGGATNPDYPDRTEAEANYKIIKEIKERFPYDKDKAEIPVIALPFGNTSVDTLQAVKEYLERDKIPVDKLVLCAEQSRLAGFLLDALHVGLLDLSKQIVTYGHAFPDSKKDFYSQRRKMPMKVLSHCGFPFSTVRRIYQWFHQRNVARRRRKETETPRS